MKQKNKFFFYSILISGITLMVGFTIQSKSQTYDLNFAALGGTAPKIEYIVVENLDRNTSVTLDGSETLHLVSIIDVQDMNGVTPLRIHPNPMNGNAEVSLYIKESGLVRLNVYNMNGNSVIKTEKHLESGPHLFLLEHLDQGMYLVNMSGGGSVSSIKILSKFSDGCAVSLKYSGKNGESIDETDQTANSRSNEMIYAPGEVLKFTAYSGTVTSVQTDVPESSKTITFIFNPAIKAKGGPWLCGSTMTVTHTAGNVAPVTKNDVVYGTATNIPGEPLKCWITSNLGSDHQASGINDATEASAGWYWQFNRKQGYKHDGFTRTPNTTWITYISENSDWTLTEDPCRLLLQSDWRIPTGSEWRNVSDNWISPWTSGLYMHHAGFLGVSNGNLYFRGSTGVYWSSTQEDNNHASYLYFDWGPDLYRNKPYGYPLRCVSDYCLTSDAGPDQNVCGATTTLSAIDPTPGTGLWSEESGASGYSFSNTADPNATFTGTPGITYLLRWTIKKDNCPDSYDDVTINLIELPTQADAGPDQTVVGSTSTTLAGNIPVIGTGEWSIQSGTGGSLGNYLAYNSTFSGVTGTTYLLRWTINHDGCISYDDVLITFGCGGTTCPGIPTVTYEGQVYNTVQIGTQCWLKENLNVGTMVNVSQDQTNNNTIEKYCYDNDPNNCSTYGGLYQWNETMQYNSTPGGQGICPTGWHVPTDGEWCTLTTFIDATVDCNVYTWSGTNAGGEMKETGTLHWYTPNTGATNCSGFTGLPGGIRHGAGFSCDLHLYACWWTSTPLINNPTNAVRRLAGYDHSNIARNGHGDDNGNSVRCLKD